MAAVEVDSAAARGSECSSRRVGLRRVDKRSIRWRAHESRRSFRRSMRRSSGNRACREGRMRTRPRVSETSVSTMGENLQANTGPKRNYSPRTSPQVLLSRKTRSTGRHLRRFPGTPKESRHLRTLRALEGCRRSRCRARRWFVGRQRLPRMSGITPRRRIARLRRPSLARGRLRSRTRQCALGQPNRARRLGGFSSGNRSRSTPETASLPVHTHLRAGRIATAIDGSYSGRRNRNSSSSRV